MRLSMVLRVLGVILLTGGALMAVTRWFPDFENDNFRRFPAPDGKLTAVVFRRTGPDAAITTNVSLVSNPSEKPGGPGNVLIANGEPAVVVKWTSARELTLSGPPDELVTLRRTSFDGVRIRP